MKSFQVALLMFILALSITSLSTYSYGIPELKQENTVALWIVLHLRDYETDMPISNVSITATTSTPQGKMNIEPTFTNETGDIQKFLGDFAKPSSRYSFNLLALELSNNYTLIKVQDSFIEDVEYIGEYVPNLTRYTEMQISLDRKDSGNQIVIEGNLWVLKGKLIKISDVDPITGERKDLSLKPAVKGVVANKITVFIISIINYSDWVVGYESYYFFPLDYEVTVIDKTQSNTEQIYPPLKVKVNEDLTVINWTYHAAEAYVNRETSRMDEDMEWLKSSGYSIDREFEEYQAIKSLLERVLDLYKKGEYGPALGGAKTSANRLESLKKWLSDLKLLAIVSSVSICLFAYGLASLLSSFIFEETSERKIRLTGKVLTFSLLMLIFSLSHPSLKITYVMLIGAAVPRIDLPISLLGCFIIGSMTYFLIELISLKKIPSTDLALQLGIRSLKRRLSRTLLTLFTITIIVSSAIVFVNISMSRASRIKESWKGTSMSGVLIEPDITVTTLSQYDINWTREQEWCKDLGYRESVRLRENRGTVTILRHSLILLGENSDCDIVGVDPAFLEKYYNFSKYVRGFWQDFQVGEPVVILPTSYEVITGEYVRLGIDEYLQTVMGGESLGMRILGPFRLVGKFDPAFLSNITKIDNSPLFENTVNLVLVPIKAVEEPYMAISEAEIITSEEADPVKVAEELAFTFGVPAIANKNELAIRIVWSLELSVSGFIPYLPPLVIASLMMYVTMASIYEERRREFITLATLGLDPRNAFQVFMIEALLLGLMGTFLGFFSSYILVAASFYLSNLVGLYGMPTLPISYAQWSMPAILVALFTGVVMVFLGGYIPAVRAQGLSLMGRVKRRQLIGELISEEKVTSFTLPIKEIVQNGEMLYRYVRETIGKFKRSLIDSHSIKGEIYGDGSFNISFVARGPGDIFISCEIKGVREREILVPVIEFPTSFVEYSQIREILRDLEEYMIGFSAWKETQLKMKIVREAPKKQETLEEILTKIHDVIVQIKDCNKKLRVLESQKEKLSEEVYNEFKQKYTNIAKEKAKTVRSMAIGLEPHSNQLQEEIKKINVEIERITIAHSLGEINEEEYVKTCSPLQGRITILKGKVKEMEEIFEFLKKPMEMM